MAERHLSRDLVVGEAKPNWLVIGGTGQVGCAILEALGSRGAFSTTRHRDGRPRLDLAQAASDRVGVEALFDRYRPAVVVIAGAMTNVEACEGDPGHAHLVNCEGPAAVARAASDHGARTVYLSSDYVFDGADGPYDEGAVPRPISVYGKSKLAGERAVLEADPDGLVVRTTTVYGPDPNARNFAYRLAASLARSQAIPVPSDQVSTPTYNRDLAAGIVAVVDARRTGITHIVGPELMTRESFARALARAWQRDDSLVAGVVTAVLGQKAARPLHGGLSMTEPPAIGFRGVAAAVADWSARPAPLALPLE